MIFGKIDYISLLPLHIYLKKYPLPNGSKASIGHRKRVPSKLNKDLFYGRIGAAIVSSIESARKKYKNLDLGICANKRVLGVLVERNTPNTKDPSSATSSALAKVLKQEGRMIIGGEALKLYLQDPSRYTDLYTKWHKKTGLPFVFARLSCVQRKALYKQILEKFPKTKIKIPYCTLQNYAEARDLDIKGIRYYSDEIIYRKTSTKEKATLKHFVEVCKALNLT